MCPETISLCFFIFSSHFLPRHPISLTVIPYIAAVKSLCQKPSSLPLENHSFNSKIILSPLKNFIKNPSNTILKRAKLNRNAYLQVELPRFFTYFHGVNQGKMGLRRLSLTNFRSLGRYFCWKKSLCRYLFSTEKRERCCIYT